MQKPKVKEISERMWEIPSLGHIVTLQTKRGRRVWTCSCTSHQKYCIENSWCFDKQLVSEFLALKPIKEHLDKLIIFYSGVGNMKVNAVDVLNDLNKLNRVMK